MLVANQRKSRPPEKEDFMPIANTVKQYLEEHGISYSVVPHRHTESSRETADAAHVPSDQLAKAVVLIDDGGYLMAVIPGDRHLQIDTLSKKLRRNLALATESRVVPVFKDCAPGAIPPLGPAYGMKTILDDSLVGLSQVYFEAGDHEDLVRVDGEQFVRLMKEAQHGQFSH
jgi:Ala-tRNA(Pro) deacylase